MRQIVQVFISVALLSAGVFSDASARLSHVVEPTFQTITLKLLPDSSGYSGTTTIALDVRAKTDTFSFHAEDLTLLTIALNEYEEPIPTTLSFGRLGLTHVKLARPLEVGTTAHLAIAFSNDYDLRANGLYKNVVDGDGYLFTQFEATEAREAFPCFDEPEFKFPYRLVVQIPTEDLALSNTPIGSEVIDGALKTVTFESTPPMPSYLLALAVGAFDTVTVPDMAYPTRVVSVK